MKVIIAGSRDITDAGHVAQAVEAADFDITEVVSGGAQGVDHSAEALCALHGMPCKVFKADWYKFGKSAGPRRNREMAAYGDALIAVWDGKSRGTQNMIDEMKKLGKPVYIHIVKRSED